MSDVQTEAIALFVRALEAGRFDVAERALAVLFDLAAWELTATGGGGHA